jgi:hypothetical protein
VLIAFLKRLPPVDNLLPERRVEPLRWLMTEAKMFPLFTIDEIDHTSPPPVAPPLGVTAPHGQYLSNADTECHGVNLNRALFGPPGQEFPTPSLASRGALAVWTIEDFLKIMRTEMTPGSYHLSGEMPWSYCGQMTGDAL